MTLFVVPSHYGNVGRRPALADLFQVPAHPDASPVRRVPVYNTPGHQDAPPRLHEVQPSDADTVREQVALDRPVRQNVVVTYKPEPSPDGQDPNPRREFEDIFKYNAGKKSSCLSEEAGYRSFEQGEKNESSVTDSNGRPRRVFRVRLKEEDVEKQPQASPGDDDEGTDDNNGEKNVTCERPRKRRFSRKPGSYPERSVTKVHENNSRRSNEISTRAESQKNREGHNDRKYGT
ncbi:hypothetical protein Bbelb_010840 [Branchiostoma belcheri]|nr:hypothetical protein Bbelb_010840 [Branchiostoma belcheri]